MVRAVEGSVVVIEGIDIWMAFLVFAVVAFVDALTALYLHAVADGRAGAAASWSGLIHMSNALIVISYMTDYRYLAFVVVGSIIGTYLGVKIRKPKL
jgi:hypothetical protein